MPYKIVSLDEIAEEYKRYVNEKTITHLDDNYLVIREFVVNTYNQLRTEGKKTYELDLELALKFYEFMNSQKDFTYEYQSNGLFWRYIAVYVIPDIIEDRFGLHSAAHFYSSNGRTYPYTLYWYIYLSWQGSFEKTYEVLKDNTTDEIMQLVERTGKYGINIHVCREMMLQYSQIPKEHRKKIVNNKEFKLFRIINMKNLAKQVILRPELYPGGECQYVKMLFGDF